MDVKRESRSRQVAAAARFLELDFAQCFAQKTRYEEAVWDVTKFAFTAYSAVLGVAIGSYQVSVSRELDLVPVAVGLLAAASVVGVFSLLMIVRIRVYFVIVTRYLNEHRGFFLSQSPLGFPNASGMFVDFSKPPFFSWASTQSWAVLMVASMNSAAVGTLSFMLVQPRSGAALLGIAVGLLTEALQIAAAVAYLRSRENRSADDAAFGKGVCG